MSRKLRRSGPTEGSRALTTETLLLEAADVASHGADVRTLASTLAGRSDAQVVVEGLLLRAVACAWDLGWQPRDLIRFARRHLAPRLVDVATAVVAIESRSYLGSEVVDARWRAQLVDIGALRGDTPVAASIHEGPDALLLSIRLLGWLRTLSSLPAAGDPPRLWGVGGRVAPQPGASANVVSKVRGLLAKAESTEFPEEAEALTAKAQELITRHAIDRALLEDESEHDAPILRRVPIDDPYPDAKAHLLSYVAHANRCQAVWLREAGFATVLGFVDDVDSVELLFTSLLVQATRSLAALGRSAPPGSNVRKAAFRRSFLHGFASQIGHRLHESAERETADAASRHGGSLLPVLARRDREVEAARAQAFPRTKAMRPAVSDHRGWVAGNAAGAAALLSLDGDVAPRLPA